MAWHLLMTCCVDRPHSVKPHTYRHLEDPRLTETRPHSLLSTSPHPYRHFLVISVITGIGRAIFTTLSKQPASRTTWWPGLMAVSPSHVVRCLTITPKTWMKVIKSAEDDGAPEVPLSPPATSLSQLLIDVAAIRVSHSESASRLPHYLLHSW